MKLIPDEDIIQHYGIKGMKWKNHQYATKKPSILGRVSSGIKSAANNIGYAFATSENNRRAKQESKNRTNKKLIKKNIRKNTTDIVSKAVSNASGGLATAGHAINIGKNTINQMKANAKYNKKLTNNTIFTKKGASSAAKTLGKTFNTTKKVASKMTKKGSWNKSLNKNLKKSLFG